MSLPNTDWLRELRSTTTPGPWKYDVNDATKAHIMWGSENIVMREDSAPPSPNPDWQLAALAPELLDEVIRLREALIRLQMDMRHQPHQYLANEVANAIRIILEGHNDG